MNKNTEYKKEIKPKYSFLEVVKVTHGFYKGYLAEIRAYEVKENIIVYEVILLKIDKKVYIKENIIKKLSFIDYIFNKELRK